MELPLRVCWPGVPSVWFSEGLLTSLGESEMGERADWERRQVGEERYEASKQQEKERPFDRRMRRW